MGTAGGCTQTRYLLGVYLLGAIDPAGRAAVDNHLARCAECGKELAGLAGLPALLSRVPAAEVYQPGEAAAGRAGQGEESPGTGLPGLPRLLTRAVRTRRARRWRGLALAGAALVLAAGGGAAVQHLLYPAPHPSLAGWLAVSASDRRTLASATVHYAPRSWGTALDAHVAARGRRGPGACRDGPHW